MEKKELYARAIKIMPALQGATIIEAQEILQIAESYAKQTSVVEPETALYKEFIAEEEKALANEPQFKNISDCL